MFFLTHRLAKCILGFMLLVTVELVLLCTHGEHLGVADHLVQILTEVTIQLAAYLPDGKTGTTVTTKSKY